MGRVFPLAPCGRGRVRGGVLMMREIGLGALRETAAMVGAGGGRAPVGGQLSLHTRGALSEAIPKPRAYFGTPDYPQG